MTKSSIGIIVGIPAIVLVAVWIAIGSGGGDNTTMEETTEATIERQTLEGGLQVQDIQEGEGAVATEGTLATVHYTGWLAEVDSDGSIQQGAQFDSSRDRGPFQFIVGAGQVIQGWDVGVQGMQVGGIRRLVIPPELGYGARGAGEAIPPNAVLLFEVELLAVEES